MAITNYERVGKAMELLKAGLAPFVEREFKNLYKGQALVEAQRFMTSERLDANQPFAAWDAAVLLRLMWDAWNDVFRKTLGQAERSLKPSTACATWSGVSSPRGDRRAPRKGLRSCAAGSSSLWLIRRSLRTANVVARAFADLYRTQPQEFPPECRDADYEKRLRAAYPIHPEVFDRLYADWSTLVK